MKARRLICHDIRQIEVEDFEIGSVPDDGLLVENEHTAVRMVDCWLRVPAAAPGPWYAELTRERYWRKQMEIACAEGQRLSHDGVEPVEIMRVVCGEYDRIMRDGYGRGVAKSDNLTDCEAKSRAGARFQGKKKCHHLRRQPRS